MYKKGRNIPGQEDRAMIRDGLLKPMYLTVLQYTLVFADLTNK